MFAAGISSCRKVFSEKECNCLSYLVANQFIFMFLGWYWREASMGMHNSWFGLIVLPFSVFGKLGDQV
jgi:hypothetical protein